MSLETVLFTRLSQHSGLSALVSTRVYPTVLPQDVTLPAVSYFRVSTERHSAMGTDTGVVSARFQVDVWATSYSSSRSVTEQVRQALQRWSNTSGTTIYDTFFMDEQDLYEDDTEIYHVALDFTFHYRES